MNTPARREPADASTRERIVQAATALIASQGYAATSISQIAKASSTHHASIYWAFANKEALLASVIDRAADQYFALLDESLRPATNLADAVHRMARPFREGSEAIRLMLMLALERRDGDPQVMAAARRARNHGITLTVSRLMSLPELARARDGATMAEQIARHMLMLFDGLFLALQIEPDTTDLDTRLEHIVRSTQALIADGAPVSP